MKCILNYNLDDLEVVDLTHLKVNQEEMMKKLSVLDDPSSPPNDNQLAMLKAASQKKRFGFKSKGWTWKQSPIKSSSIEEEPPQTTALLLDSPSPKKSLSSKSSTPNQSPKHRVSSSETIRNCSSDEMTSFRRHKNNRIQQQQQSISNDSVKAELRSSASARLIQLFDSKDGIDKLSPDYEFHSLLPENGRPASIHVLQTIKSEDI